MPSPTFSSHSTIRIFLRTAIAHVFNGAFTDLHTPARLIRYIPVHPGLYPSPTPLLTPSLLSSHARLYIHAPYCFISRLQSIRKNLPRAIFFHPMSALRNALCLGTFTTRINTMAEIAIDSYFMEFACNTYSYHFLDSRFRPLATILRSSVFYVILAVPDLPSSRDPFNGSFMGGGRGEGVKVLLFSRSLI